MQTKRPVNLSLTTIHFPLPAIISILHRITGVWLFLALPILLWRLGQSLASQASFNAVHHLFFSSCAIRTIVWTVLAAATFHLIAGIRHMFMDCGFGESLKGGRITAFCVLIIAAILIVIEGVWLW